MPPDDKPGASADTKIVSATTGGGRLRRLLPWVWALIWAVGFALILGAMGLKGAYRDLPKSVFWTLTWIGIVLVCVGSSAWGVGRSEGWMSSYSSIEEGTEEMERWKWRLRRKNLRKVRRPTPPGQTPQS
jgi:hypothetical protein